jgi:hypothetical protein
MHNTYRNKTAAGLLRNEIPTNLKYYPTAVRMLTVRWDDSLAYVAEANTRQCQMKHDACRVTRTNTYVGQNLCSGYSTGQLASDEALIMSCMASWFNEYKKVADPVGTIKTCCNSGAGHFTQMVTDRVTAVGCAMIKFFANSRNNYIFACNYNSVNMIGASTYQSGTPVAGKCTQKNPTYPALCYANDVNIAPY